MYTYNNSSSLHHLSSQITRYIYIYILFFNKRVPEIKKNILNYKFMLSKFLL